MKSVILSLTFILGTQVFIVSIAGAINKAGINVNGEIDASDPTRNKRAAAKCGKTLKILKGQSPAFSSKDHTSQPQCDWAFIGDTDCSPEIKCSTIDLPKTDEDCSDEYLLISDGIGGELKVCGKVTFDKPLRASGTARDLFVRYKSGGTKKGNFKCTVTCSTKAEGLHLPLDFVRKEDSRCVCGLQNNDNRIVGGEDSKMNEFPWQAAIVFKGTRSPKCGASVINDRFILTATHCFYFENIKPTEIEVLIHAFVLDMTKKDDAADVPLGQEGSIRGKGYNMKKFSDADENTQRFKVAEIIMHPMFTESYDYDYALLRLDKKIDLSSADAPTPVCLPGPNSTKTTFEGTNPLVVGWGMPDELAGGTTRLLQKLAVPVIPLKKCQGWLPGTVTQRMICAGFEEGKKDACTGDSGGPLILQRDTKQWWQIGIVSWGEGCAQKHKPGLYSRVTEMQQWITYHASQNDAKWCKDTK